MALRLLAFLGVSLAALSAAGAQPVTESDRSYATQRYTPQGFELPEGRGCSGEVARWQAIQENDYRSGNIGLPVFHRIQSEIAQAAAACQAGRDAQATAMIHASKARHGYPQ